MSIADDLVAAFAPWLGITEVPSSRAKILALDDLWLYWPFEEVSGGAGAVTQDASPNNRDGTLAQDFNLGYSSLIPTEPEGLSVASNVVHNANAVQAVGTPFQPAQACTIGMRVRASTSNSPAIIGNSSNGPRLTLGGTGTLTFDGDTASGGATAAFPAGTLPLDGEVHSLFFKVDDGPNTAEVLIDGVSKGVLSYGDAVPGTGNFRLGSHAGSNGGQVEYDDVFITTGLVDNETLAAIHALWLEYGVDPLEDYLRTIGEMFTEVELYAFDTDEEEGWTILLDVDRCPYEALPYLAQYVGERLPPGLTDAAARQWIRDAPNQERGTISSIVKAAKRYLTGPQLVTLIERDGDPDAITVVTYTAQTPNQALVARELETVVPADITLNYIVSAGQTWSQVQVTHATWNSITDGDPATWADLMAATPDGTYGGGG